MDRQLAAVSMETFPPKIICFALQREEVSSDCFSSVSISWVFGNQRMNGSFLS